jgi:phosphate transport system substrate-binding protein
MKKFLTRLIIFLAIGGVLYYGSTHRELTSNVSSNTSNSKQTASKNILSVGSTAMQPLAEQAGELFEKENNGTTVTVQGGGSGAGLTQIQSGSVQIGNSDVFAEQKSGIDANKIIDHKVAVVGIAPVVNLDVKISNLTTQQLQDIFTGKITNWKEVGGNDLSIVVINRAAGSGTRTVFEYSILKGNEAIKAQEQDSNGTVQKIVKSTPGAISYLGFGFIDPTQLTQLSVDGIKGNAENVSDNKWKIWGYEHMYTQKNPNETTSKFIKYFLSEKVQHGVVKKLGYIPLDQMKVEKDATGKVADK